MTFCTRCGHKNQPEDRFCEECGNPLGTPAGNPAQANMSSGSTDPHSSSASAPAQRLPGKRLALYLGAGFVVLMAIAAGLFFLLANEAPSKEVFAKAIDRALMSDPPPDLKSQYCLQNFPYDKDPVNVNGYDTGTQRWLSVLTQAGLYSEPETVTQTNGFFQSTALLYKKTEAGKKATQGRFLCIADGFTVASVESFSPPEKLGRMEVSRANVTLALKNPMPWVSTEEARAVFPSLGQETNRSFLLSLKDKKWEVANENTVRSAGMDQRRQAIGSAQTQMVSSLERLFAKLNDLFSFAGANPLIGRWKSDVMGITIASFEFDNNSMVSNGRKVHVRYDIEDNRVTVYADGDDSGTIFNVIDKDTLSINAGLMEMKLRRVQ